MSEDKPVVPKTAYVSAVFAYFVLIGWSLIVARALPSLLAMLETSPRLAVSGMLGLWLAPLGITTFLHHVMTSMLDGLDHKRLGGGYLPGMMSVWAGLFTWFVLLFATSVSAFVLMILFPKTPEESVAFSSSIFGALAWIQDGEKTKAWVHMASWMLVASQLYAFEARVKAHIATKKDV